MGQAKNRGSQEVRIAQAHERAKYAHQMNIDTLLLSPVQRSLYLEMVCKRGGDLSKSIPHGEAIWSTFFELLKFVVENEYRGGCHDTSAVLYMLLAELGIESTLCVGEVGLGKKFFDHSWIEINGQIFDVAICMPLQAGLAVGGPLFANVDLSTGGLSTLQFGVQSGQGLCDVAHVVLDSDLVTYAKSQREPNLWTLAVVMHSRCGNVDATFQGFNDRYGQVRRKLRASAENKICV
jgi:hypothetical protein